MKDLIKSYEHGFDGFWYRAEIKHYSVADEWGDHSHTTTRLDVTKYAVVKATPKGVWLVPAYGEKDPDYYLKMDPGCQLFSPQFVRGEGTKQFACPTRETALADCLKRKERHIQGCQARLRQAEQDLFLILREMPWVADQIQTIKRTLRIES